MAGSSTNESKRRTWLESDQAEKRERKEGIIPDRDDSFFPGFDPRQFVGDAGLKDHSSAEWLKRKMKGARDTELAEVFIQELREAERSGKWWNFMLVSLGEDHTRGLLPDAFTPAAAIASNDLARGRRPQGGGRPTDSARHRRGGIVRPQTGGLASRTENGAV
jgi:hypothetical protein